MSNKNEKVWYHGTSQERLDKIMKEGKLHGTHNNGKRFTYLCLDKYEASAYGEVTLRVNYDPTQDLFNNNFHPGATEIKVTTPIGKANIKRV